MPEITLDNLLAVAHDIKVTSKNEVEALRSEVRLVTSGTHRRIDALTEAQNAMVQKVAEQNGRVRRLENEREVREAETRGAESARAKLKDRVQVHAQAPITRRDLYVATTVLGIVGALVTFFFQVAPYISAVVKVAEAVQGLK